jgi:Glycosyltransferase family 87
VRTSSREARDQPHTDSGGVSLWSRPSVFTAGAIGIALLLFGYYRATWGNRAQFSQALDVCYKTFCDFADYYYPMGEAIFRSGTPVQGFVYSPFVAILLAAFTPLPISTALAVWGALLGLAIVLYVALVRRLVPAPLPLQLFFVALILSSFPLLHTVMWGQVTLFTTVALLGMLLFYERGWLAAAAALFAFAVSFKFYPLIFVSIFVARRDGRFLLWATGACAMLLIAVPVLFLGLEQTVHFYDALRIEYGGFDWAATSYNSQYFPHVGLRLVSIAGGAVPGWLPSPDRRWLPLLQAGAWAIVLANLALLYRVQHIGMRHANLWSAGLLFLTIPFLLGTSWPVDLVPLSFSQAFVATAILLRDETAVQGEAPARNHIWPLPMPNAIAGLLILLSMALTNIVFFNIFGDRTVYGGLGFVFWADALLLVAVYVLLLPAACRRA